jgi:hypothetical protein
MKKHWISFATLTVLVFLAFGSTDDDEKKTDQPEQGKAEQTGAGAEQAEAQANAPPSKPRPSITVVQPEGTGTIIFTDKNLRITATAGVDGAELASFEIKGPEGLNLKDSDKSVEGIDVKTQLPMGEHEFVLTAVSADGVEASSVLRLSKPVTARFPAVVRKFIKLNELKQEAFADAFPGTSLSGKGKVFNVEKCGFMDDSEKHGRDCYKVVLDAGEPRICLYFGEKDKAQVAEYNKGQAMTFENCRGISIKNWGLWSTATCDMP